MSYYSGKRTRNIYDPQAENTFNISRTRIELFMECPRCFYIDRRLGVDRPPGFPFTINNTVDSRLKSEFDKYPYQLLHLSLLTSLLFQVLYFFE